MPSEFRFFIYVPYCSQVGTSSLTTIEIRGLKKDSSYNFRVIAKNLVGCSEPFIIEETFTAAKADIPKSENLINI